MAKQEVETCENPHNGMENLKFKYRDPNNRPVRKNGAYKQRSNSAKKGDPGQGKGHRRRSYPIGL